METLRNFNKALSPLPINRQAVQRVLGERHHQLKLKSNERAKNVLFVRRESNLWFYYQRPIQKSNNKKTEKK